ncbi:probable S-adenosylmethionine-dependent methyltransferase At5g38780 [Sesamum indicum]|uniref:Probable S-adenosylmethionine-dependent methyltransferase At5g38780 n=1 Tax=Sesamum indicum TaxID=4182 RepID=A0A6I9SLG3_SESIN|nr:probable S-adenosylmethionine-dependent methyltransferase At5g38780 [Sesamum indicum]
MAQLYAMVNCFQYPRMSIRRTLSSPLDSRHRIQLNPGEQTMETSVSNLYAMNGGEGPTSYAQNSSYQRGVVDVAKPIIEEEISMKLDVKQLLLTNTKSFRIADFGCSTGHNSFPAMQIITEAVEKKFQTEGLNSQIPDFQVFFNDQVMNDFNTLFLSLPPQRSYHAAGVPGPFHGRLFPNASLDFAYCSCALNWLSEVPKAVADHNSPAWNNGKVHYTEARQEVFEAYSNHYVNDIGAFLNARAQELVQGGLMALLVPAVPAFKNSGTSYTTPTEMDLIGSCLVDMAKKGRFGEEKVDSFNFPLYFTIPDELKTIIGRSDSFNIERMEILNNPGKRTLRSVNARATYLRAVFEGLLINHFGSEIMDELFELYTKKLAASPHFLDPDNEKSIIIFVLLKRKVE